MFDRTTNRLRRALALLKKRVTRSTPSSPQDPPAEEPQTPRAPKTRRAHRTDRPDSTPSPEPKTHRQRKPAQTDENDTPDDEPIDDESPLPAVIDFDHPDRGMPDHIDRSRPSIIEGNPAIIDTNNYTRFVTTYTMVRQYIDTSPLKHSQEYYAVTYEPGPQHTAYDAHWHIYIQK